MPVSDRHVGMSTERADPNLAEIDRWPTRQAVEAMLDGQRQAIEAIASQTGALAIAAEAAAERLGSDGRLGYAGAGTSGRVGVQDGVELTPTFGWPETRLAFFIAGGEGALMRAVEGAEDDAGAGRQAVADAEFGPSDVLIGIAASGRTPFTIAAIEEARARGSLTIAIASNAQTPLLAAAEHGLLLDTGSEAVAGSTRMKAGTAQKAALNLLSTAIMLRQGLVHRGLMVDMQITNAKLYERAVRMVCEIAGVDPALARTALDQGERNIRRSVLIALGLEPADARQRMEAEPRDFATLVERLRSEDS